MFTRRAPHSNILPLLAALLALVLTLAWLPGRPVQASAITWPTSAAAANSAGRWPTLAEIPCGAYIVMNRSTGQVLLEKSSDKPMYPASTTKVLTALIALERLDPNRQITLSPKAVALTPNASRVGYKAGEQVYVRDLLAGLMLASGNDAANAIAESISGSMEAFAPVMNERARQAGATHSNFVTPSGVHNELHVTTAHDLALITTAAMKNANFRTLVSLESASMPATNLHPINGWAILINTNRMLLFDNNYLASSEIRSVTGVKTGSTNEAGDNLVASAVTADGTELVAVLMKAPISTVDSNKFVSMRTLLEEGARVARKAGPTSATSAASATTGAASSATTGAGTTATTGAGTAATTAAGTGGTSAGTSAGPDATTNAGGTTSITQLGGTSAPAQTTGTAVNQASTNFGALEGLRQKLDVSPSVFLTAISLIGLLIGLTVGLALIAVLYRATHRRRQRPSGLSGRPRARR